MSDKRNVPDVVPSVIHGSFPVTESLPIKKWRSLKSKQQSKTPGSIPGYISISKLVLIPSDSQISLSE